MDLNDIRAQPWSHMVACHSPPSNRQRGRSLPLMGGVPAEILVQFQSLRQFSSKGNKFVILGRGSLVVKASPQVEIVGSSPTPCSFLRM